MELKKLKHFKGQTPFKCRPFTGKNIDDFGRQWNRARSWAIERGGVFDLVRTRGAVPQEALDDVRRTGASYVGTGINMKLQV